MGKLKNITRIREMHTFAAETFHQLIELKQQNNEVDFNNKMEQILPGVRRYIAHQLTTAIRKEHIPAGKYKVEDFIGDLYIQAFDHIHEVKKDKHFYVWLYKKADEILEDTIVEEDFDNFFFKNIDNYTKVEWDAMEEKYTNDGDGDFVMIEELDDPSYPKNDYVLQDVFIENDEKDLIEKLNKELTQEEIRKHTETVLQRLPFPMRTVFELTVNHQFEPKEIAEIRNISIQEVNQLLANARKRIRLSFEARYLFTKS